MERTNIDMANAFEGVDKDYIEQSIATSISETDWTFFDIDPDQIDFRICGNNNLVQCCNKDREPIIKTEIIENQQLAATIFLATINSELVIIR